MTALLARLHATLLIDAARCEAIARRLAGSHPDRAECELADAHEKRATAAALADTLRRAGEDVTIPDPRQVTLFSDGIAP